MKEESVWLNQKNEELYEIIVIHNESNSSYGMEISIKALLQLKELLAKEEISIKDGETFYGTFARVKRRWKSSP